MYVKFGSTEIDPYVPSMPERLDDLFFYIFVMMSVSRRKVMNDPTRVHDDIYRYWVVKSVLTFFPDMYRLLENDRYVEIMANQAKKYAMRTNDWLEPEYVEMRRKTMLAELRRMRDRVEKHEMSEYDRFMRKVWKQANRRTGWDYATSADIVRDARHVVVEYGTRHLGNDVVDALLARYVVFLPKVRPARYM